MRPTEAEIWIEVVYALPAKQEVVILRLPAGATALGAVLASGLPDRYPELAQKTIELGIYSKRIPSDTLLRNGDRVEIYRALKADPKDARRRKAASRPQR